MLEAVHCVHQAHVVHADLKPANFLFVESNLKLIDFGIARQIEDDQTSAIRDSAVGTLNYMAPEAIQNQSGMQRIGQKQCLKIGPAADVWSLGCILYLMAYGKTPFQHCRNPMEKLMAIVNDDYKIGFPACEHRGLVEVMKQCLQRDPKNRPSIPTLLQHRFLNPTAAGTPRKTPSKAGMTQEQLYAVLRGLQNGMSGASPGTFSRKIFSELANGGDLSNLSSVLGGGGGAPRSASRRVEPAQPPARTRPPQMAPLSSLQQQQPPARARSGLAKLDANAFALGRTGLKRAPTAQKPTTKSVDDGSLQGVLRNKFKSINPDFADQDTTADTSEWNTQHTLSDLTAA
jgi:serine/threonine-protein kinase TTK/MPS1